MISSATRNVTICPKIGDLRGTVTQKSQVHQVNPCQAIYFHGIVEKIEYHKLEISYSITTNGGQLKPASCLSFTGCHLEQSWVNCSMFFFYSDDLKKVSLKQG